MKIIELQQSLVDEINACEELVQGGCKAFAEDTRTVYDEAEQFASSGGVSIVIVTPTFNRSGGGVDDGLPFEAELIIRCVERTALSAASPGTIRALDAAEIVSHLLDGETLEWRSIRQESDPRHETITATIVFGYAGTLN
jgi:hypothetical protein